ncbi:putative Fungal specific transcription factor [Pleurostoma richardsiae]|uniref:Fungal specific transcription factor n=1 Tax=Pleurostoma richardsiae TaxID=41990 RepID=A0AA38RD33_9PEZI|nr:putative Fungal specific transcription factor [Pleurostoma richardsiae]
MSRRPPGNSLSPVPPNRRRDKPQLSCDSCRQRKVKCDRQRPCRVCQARGLSSSCTYPPPDDLPARPKPAAGSNASFKSRLQRLESMLLSLSDRSPSDSCTDSASAAPLIVPQLRPGASTAASPPAAPQLPEPGSLRINPSETVYVSSAHWSAILENVSELRDCFRLQEQDETPAQPALASNDLGNVGRPSFMGPMLFSSFIPAATKAELVAAMPDRSVVDRLIFLYFTANTPSSSIIHVPSFLRQYEAFWVDPYSVDMAWLALLYGIMALASYVTSGPPNGPGRDHIHGQEYEPKYLKQLTQSIVLAGVSRGGPYCIETLCHYLFVEHVSRPDAIAGNWLLAGMIIRLALRMGYHREPSQFSKVSPFQAEMRRRLWIVVYAVDALLSIQMGVPRMVKEGQWDTRLPRNLLDSDFDEDNDELPQGRPLTEVTPATFIIFRFQLTKAIASISDLTLTTTIDKESHSSALAVKELDKLLRDTYDSIPSCMKYTSLTASLLVSARSILDQLTLTMIFQKGLILLHRWYAATNGALAAPCDSRYVAPEIATSVHTCVGAAMKMLGYQDLLHTEMQPNGTFSGMQWSLTSSMWNEFLVATSVLCTYLYNTATKIGSVEETNVFIESDGQLRGVRQALTRAHEIWQSMSELSWDARRAARMIDVLMAKLDGGGGPYNDASAFMMNPGMMESTDAMGAQVLDDSFCQYMERYDGIHDGTFW